MSQLAAKASARPSRPSARRADGIVRAEAEPSGAVGLVVRALARTREAAKGPEFSSLI